MNKAVLGSQPAMQPALQRTDSRVKAPPTVLSIIEEYLGHKTYGKLMRAYFEQSSDCSPDFYWYNEDRELRTRVINRLLGYYPSRRWMREQNITLHLFRIQLGFAYMARRLLLRKLQQKQYRALHLHTQPLAYLVPEILRQIPTVVSIDRTIAQTAREKTHPSFRWTYQPNHWLDGRVYHQAAKVVTFSEAARRSVIEDYQIAPDKVHTVYPGVDLQQFPLPASLPESSSERRFNILFIGSEFERKGGNDLLQVFLERFADQAELHLVTSHPIACHHPHVHVYTHIQAYTPEWRSLYQNADVFIMPTYSEAFGWVFVEAMAAGLPIIATRLEATPEIVRPGETGFLVQPGDRPALAQSLQALIDNPALGQAMGQQARAIAERQFNAQHHFQTLESLFYEITGTPQ